MSNKIIIKTNMVTCIQLDEHYIMLMSYCNSCLIKSRDLIAG